MSDLTIDGAANDCRHDSASGADTTSLTDPAKVWRCDHCGMRWTQGEYGRVPVTAPLLATRDALATAIHATHSFPETCDFPPQPGLCMEAGRQADALLASGVVRDPLTLVDDETLIEAVYRGRCARHTARSVLRALAAALTEDPS